LKEIKKSSLFSKDAFSKPDWNRICLALGIIVFVMGFLMLCDCPGVFAMSAILTAVSAWKGRKLTRIVAVIFCSAAVVIAVLQTIREGEEHERIQQTKDRLEKKN
jgi:hypothetical protein